MKEINKSKVYRRKKEESKRSYCSTQSLPSLRSTNPPLLYSDRPIYHHRHERKIEVERRREFQIPELSSPLALYLCLLFLFFSFLFGFHILAKRTVLASQKDKIEGLTKITLQINSEKRYLHSTEALFAHRRFLYIRENEPFWLHKKTKQRDSRKLHGK